MSEPLSAPSPAPQSAATSSRALASVLLAGAVATLLVWADQRMDTWAQTHALAATLALWALAVGAIIVLRGLTRHWARLMVRALDRSAARLAQRRADRRLWSLAQQDQRLMADLQSALGQQEHSPPRDVLALTERQAERLVRQRLYQL